jgi:hypothetical protein
VTIHSSAVFFITFHQHQRLFFPCDMLTSPNFPPFDMLTSISSKELVPRVSDCRLYIIITIKPRMRAPYRTTTILQSIYSCASYLAYRCERTSRLRNPSLRIIDNFRLLSYSPHAYTTGKCACIYLKKSCGKRELSLLHTNSLGQYVSCVLTLHTSSLCFMLPQIKTTANQTN